MKILRKTIIIPLLAVLAAGCAKEVATSTNLLEEEYIEEYVSLPASMFGKGTFFLLRAKGESMIEADDGALLLLNSWQVKPIRHIHQILSTKF